jgi:hypothetical protein
VDRLLLHGLDDKFVTRTNTRTTCVVFIGGRDTNGCVSQRILYLDCIFKNVREDDVNVQNGCERSSGGIV